MAQTSEESNGIVETIKTVVYALLIAGIFRTLFFQPFWIPSGWGKPSQASCTLPIMMKN